jgi:hypothetical protein
MQQEEITRTVPVLNAAGQSVNKGWARSALFVYNTDLVWASKLRMSAGDRYIVFSPTHTFVFEVFDGGTLGYTRIAIISLRDKRQFQNIVTTAFPLGSFELPASSEDGSIKLRPQKSIFDFIVLRNIPDVNGSGPVRIIRIDMPAFSHHRSLRGELVLQEPPHAQSIVTNTTWTGHKNRFAISRVSPWFIVEGVMQFESADIVFSRGNGWGIYDWYRAVRPRADTHFWAAACGMQEGRLISFNAGYGSADSSLGTENAFFVDGRLHKLNQVTFQINPSDWMSPWRFTSNDQRLEMTFTPQQEFTHQTAQFFFSRRFRQVFGIFSGKVILDDGTTLEFKNLNGIAERRKTRL